MVGATWVCASGGPAGQGVHSCPGGSRRGRHDDKMVDEEELRFAFSNVRDAIGEGAPDRRVKRETTIEAGLSAEMVVEEVSAIMDRIVEEHRDYATAKPQDFTDAFEEFVRRVAAGMNPRFDFEDDD